MNQTLIGFLDDQTMIKLTLLDWRGYVMKEDEVFVIAKRFTKKSLAERPQN